MLGWIYPDGTQWRQGSPDAPDATRYVVGVQDAQDAQDAGSRRGESGRNTTVSDEGHLFADVCLVLNVIKGNNFEVELEDLIMITCYAMYISIDRIDLWNKLIEITLGTPYML